MISKKHSNYHIIIGDDIESAFQEAPVYMYLRPKLGIFRRFSNFMSVYFYKILKGNKENSITSMKHAIFLLKRGIHCYLNRKRILRWVYKLINKTTF